MNILKKSREKDREMKQEGSLEDEGSNDGLEENRKYQPILMKKD